MTDHFAHPDERANPPRPRQLIAAGLIRRASGRTLTVRITAAGVTGTITKEPHARAARLAELHRLCREDYNSSAPRRAQNHRDDTYLIASVSEAVAQ
ncbi:MULTISPECIES: hypothetical protein [Streptomyces]|uniref:hypothetical protein n=1 Tax=Streptomyces TaxID=1883 RepID=UPI0033D18E02